MAPAWIAFLDGLLALALLIAGIVGAHNYLVAPFLGFQMFALGFLLSILGALVGLLAIFMTRKPERRAGRNRAVVGTVICFAIALPILVTMLRGLKYPPINDITTDVDNPPEFTFAATIPANQGRDLKYDKAKYAERQLAGYGVIAPVREKLEPAAEFQRISEVAGRFPNWKITRNDPSSMTLEAVATSKLFHFNDDVILQVRPAPDGGSLIVMRSKSRDGIGDFGVNARRIRRFFDHLTLSREQADSEEMP